MRGATNCPPGAAESKQADAFSPLLFPIGRRNQRNCGRQHGAGRQADAERQGADRQQIRGPTHQDERAKKCDQSNLERPPITQEAAPKRDAQERDGVTNTQEQENPARLFMGNPKVILDQRQDRANDHSRRMRQHPKEPCGEQKRMAHRGNPD